MKKLIAQLCDADRRDIKLAAAINIHALNKWYKHNT